MAASTSTTLARRSAPHVARMAARNGQDAPTCHPSDAALRARHRAELEERITRLIAQLDALDWDPDLEPEHDECDEDAEASAQPSTLAPDRLPARVIRFPARQAVQS